MAEIISQLEFELGHYRRFAFTAGVRLEVSVPPVSSRWSGSHSWSVSRALSGASVRQSPRPPTAPSPAPAPTPAPVSAPTSEGEGESAP